MIKYPHKRIRGEREGRVGRREERREGGNEGRLGEEQRDRRMEGQRDGERKEGDKTASHFISVFLSAANTLPNPKYQSYLEKYVYVTIYSE